MSNNLLAQIAHYFLLIPWFSKEMQICSYIVCWPSHCFLSCSLSSTYWTCSTGAKLRRVRVSRTQSASGKPTVRQWEKQICIPIDSKQPEHAVPRSIRLACQHPPTDLLVEPQSLQTSSSAVASYLLWASYEKQESKEGESQGGTVMAKGAKVGGLCCWSKTTVLSHGAFVLGGCHWALLQPLTGLLLTRATCCVEVSRVEI